MTIGRQRRVVVLAVAAVAVGGCGGSQATTVTSQSTATTSARPSRPSATSATTAPASTAAGTSTTAASTGTAAGSTGTAAASTGTAAGSTGTAAASTGTAAAQTSTEPASRSAPNPGTLPQTMQLPSASTPTFKAEMAGLWRAVQLGIAEPGLPAFFPEAAYLQVKAISNAAADYRDRLLGDYALDIGAAHALLGSGPTTARLVEVLVPKSYAHWVPPNACYNRYGYYEVPNSRVVYREGGQLRSFGIASMISWRGVWYVVHLGAVLRNSATGVVDDPTTGAGVSAPSSTC